MQPFELFGRRHAEGGVILVFRCMECRAESTLFIDDKDELDQNYPVACPCGVEVNMYFGAPVIGKKLLRKLKHTPLPEDAFRRSHATPCN